jgi:hypothetical protein
MFAFLKIKFMVAWMARKNDGKSGGTSFANGMPWM